MRVANTIDLTEYPITNLRFTERKKQHLHLIKAGEDEFNPELILTGFSSSEASITSNYSELQGIKDLEIAPNVGVFLTSGRFVTDPPLPKQLELLLKMFGDICVPCSDKRIVDNMYDQPLLEILGRITLLEHGVCPKCGKNRLELAKEGHLNFYRDFVGCIGQRAGKTVTSAYIGSYCLHRFLTAPNLYELYHIPTKTRLHMIFSALTYKQAEETVWDWFRSFVFDSPWFNDFHRILSENEMRLGRTLFKINDTKISYTLPSRKLSAYPMGPDLRKMRGRTGLFYTIDEVAYFDANAAANKVKLNADEVNTALARSLTTVRNAVDKARAKGMFDIPDAISALISSPVAPNDKIMREINIAKKLSNKKGCPILSVHMPTWEMNPEFKRDSPVIELEFLRNPIAAMRDYGAVPPLSDAPFIENTNLLQACVDKDRDQARLITVKYKKRKTKFDNNYVYATLNPRFTNKNIARIIAVDLGHVNNAFAICMMHQKVVASSETGKTKNIVDFVLEVKPEQGEQVHFPLMLENAIAPLIRAFDIKAVVFDQWQSVDHRQRIMQTYANELDEDSLAILEENGEEGVQSYSYSLKQQDFLAFKQRIIEGTIRFATPEVPFKKIIKTDEFNEEEFDRHQPATMLLRQVLTVREAGKTVIKGINMDDDIFRTVVLGSTVLDMSDFEVDADEEEAAPQIDYSTMYVVGKTIGKVGSNSNYGIDSNNPLCVVMSRRR